MARPRTLRPEAPPNAPTIHRDLQGRLAANVQRLRAAKGWNQEEAAWRSDLAVRLYQRIETGTDVNVTLGTLAKLCAAFEVDARDVLVPAAPPPRRPPGRPRKQARPSPKPTRTTTRRS